MSFLAPFQQALELFQLGQLAQAAQLAQTVLG